MLKFRFRLPRLGDTPIIDRKCPRCLHPRGHIHGRKIRRIQDAQHSEVRQVRLRCPKCSKTWSCYPVGVKPYKRRSDRAVALGIMLYFYGLSYRYASAALDGQGIQVHFTQIYRDLLEACEKAEAITLCQRRAHPLRVPRLGVDGTSQRLKGRPAVGLIFASNLDNDTIVDVQRAQEDDPLLVQSWLRTWRDLFGVEAIMTDGHSNYEFLDDSSSLEVQHLHCQAHFVKAKVIRLRQLREECQRRRYARMVALLDKLDLVLHDLSPPQSAVLQQLFEQVVIYKQSYSRARRRPRRRPRHYTPGYRLYLLVTEVFDRFPDLVAQSITTNNATERGIGLSLKIRSKLMRGFQKEENALHFARFAAFARSHRPRFDLGMVV